MKCAQNKRTGRRIALVLLTVTGIICCAGCSGSAGKEDETESTSSRRGSTVAEEITITINPEGTSPVNGGKFEGWGTSLCWWANRIGYSDTLSELAATAFYDAEEGLGLNIARYNIGGGDDPEHDHITRTDSEVPGYAVYDEEANTWTYDWDADANQRNVLSKITQVCDPDELIVEGFANSAPYFMTNSGCTSGAEDANSDNLNPEYVEAFADYLAEVTLHFKDSWGITFQSLSPMNEPYTNYWGAYSNKQEGCHFDQGESQSNMLVALSDALEQKGLSDVLVVGTDETSIDTQISSYNALSDEAKSVLGRIDTHTYGGSNRSGLLSLASSEGKNLWMSEVDGGDIAGVAAGEMGAALWLAQRIITDINGLKPSAWVLWQAIDNHVSAEGYNGNSDTGMVALSGGYWGLAVANHDEERIVLTQKYYAMGQFSRYIRPGYEIIGVSDDSTSLAAYDEDSGRLVIVVINTTLYEQPVTFDLSAFSAVGDTAQPIRTSGSRSSGESWAELEKESVDGSSFSTSLPANSITTYLIDGVSR